MNIKVPMKKVNWYENYFVTNDGRIWNSRTKKVLNPYYDGKYMVIGLHKDKKRTSYRIHRLVAEYFIPNPNKCAIVIHKNKNKTDNNFTNLQWADVVYVSSDADIKAIINECESVYSCWYIKSRETNQQIK